MGDGREVCRTIKSAEETQNIPIILMSADYKALENYADCLADAILEKPFHLCELVSKVESLIVSRL
jgi:DNA-binding response OmpR family regulator